MNNILKEITNLPIKENMMVKIGIKRLKNFLFEKHNRFLQIFFRNLRQIHGEFILNHLQMSLLLRKMCFILNKNLGLSMSKLRNIKKIKSNTKNIKKIKESAIFALKKIISIIKTIENNNIYLSFKLIDLFSLKKKSKNLTYRNITHLIEILIKKRKFLMLKMLKINSKFKRNSYFLALLISKKPKINNYFKLWFQKSKNLSNYIKFSFFKKKTKLFKSIKNKKKNKFSF